MPYHKIQWGMVNATRLLEENIHFVIYSNIHLFPLGLFTVFLWCTRQQPTLLYASQGKNKQEVHQPEPAGPLLLPIPDSILNCRGLLLCLFRNTSLCFQPPSLELLKTKKRLLRTLEVSFCLFEPGVLGSQVPKRGTEREELGFGLASPFGSIRFFRCRWRQGTQRIVLRPEAPASPGSLLEMKQLRPIHRLWWSKSAF